MRQNSITDFPLWMKVVLAAMIFILLAGGVWFFKAQQRQHLHEVKARLWSIAQLKAKQLGEWRAERLADASVLMGRRALIEAAQRFFFCTH